jgi:hypothetical protein
MMLTTQGSGIFQSLLRYAAALAVLLSSSAVHHGAPPADVDAPPDLAPYFQPPAEFAEQFGSYRSPLLFYDGTRVQTASDWTRRREEIRRRWHDIMGPWPHLIDKPNVEILDESVREDFIQRRVRVEIATQQTTDGYLLIPRRAGPMPAAFVPFYEPETSIGLGQGRRDFAYQLTKRGFVTLSIGSPGGDARQPKKRRRNVSTALVSRVYRGKLCERFGESAGG